MSNKQLGAAAVIFDEAGRVLLVKQSYGKHNWELPGGKAEPNESAQETAKREVQEETGLDISVSGLTGVYYDPDYDMHHFVFICKNDHNQIPQPSSPEILECRYYPVDELPRPISDFTCKRIHHSLHRQENSLFHIIGPRQWLE